MVDQKSKKKIVAKIGGILVGFASTLILVLTFFIFTQNGPEALTIKFQLPEDGAVDFELKAKSPDPKQRFHITKQPAFGRLLGEFPKITYKPNDNFNGKDHLEYTVELNDKTSSPAWVEFEVTKVNDAPEANDQQITMSKNAIQPITLTGTDQDQDFLNYEIIQYPSNGVISGTPPFIKYTPTPGFLGQDSLIFRVDDALSGGQEGKVTITVTKENQPPLALDTQLTTLIDQPLEIQLTGLDKESDPLTFEVVSEPKHGTLRFAENKLIYQPQKAFEGKDLFHFIAKDKLAPSQVAEVNIQVLPLSSNEVVGEKLKAFITDGGVRVGSLGNPEFIFHEGDYTPASLSKIGTAAAAFHYLGFDHQFQTKVFLDSEQNLYIKGYGDPYFGSHSWHTIAKYLKEKGHFKNPINQVIIDATTFETRPDFVGREKTTQVYDAPLGALASNQNMGIIEVKPGGVVLSVLGDTPMTKKLKKKAKGYPLGIRRLAVAYTPNEGTHYSRELGVAILTQYGMTTNNEARIGQTPPDLKPLMVLKSKKPLSELVRQMLFESNNYIANQLVMAIALERSGQPAKLEEGVYLLNRFLQNEVKLGPEEVFMAEGSGLSRKSHITLKGMIKLLDYFKDYKNLLPELKYSKFNSLAKSGKKVRVLAKTGTLNGVSNIAGYIYTDDENWKPFVIMLNHPKSARSKAIAIIVNSFH